MQRKKALDLWRDIARALKGHLHDTLSRGRCTDGFAAVPKSQTRTEMRKFARDEFERNKDITDISHIRYLISVSFFLLARRRTIDRDGQTGRTQFDGMKRYIDEQAS